MADPGIMNEVPNAAPVQPKAQPVAEHKCPHCGGPLRFDPERGLMVCDYCKTTHEIQAAQDEPAQNVTGFDFGSLNQKASRTGAESLPVYSCVSCGSELIAAPQQLSLSCPYCRNNIVLTDKVSGSLRPDGIIPFRIDSKMLPESMNRFYKGKVLLPPRFFSESTMGNVTGVYVPFWVFSGNVSGNVTLHGSTSRTYTSGDYEYTETTGYELDREVDMSFDNVPVDAGSHIDDAMMDSLEPFDMNDVRPFDIRFLAGFAAERFDLEKNDIAGRARERILNTAYSYATGRETSYSNVGRSGGQLNLELDARYLLFPVYFFNLKFDGKEYGFAVNGQTGETVGSLPIDKGVCLRYFLLRAGLVLLGVLIIFILKYLAGR